jgi:hypothetical protein
MLARAPITQQVSHCLLMSLIVLCLCSLSHSHSSHREGEREMPVHAIANLSIHNIAAAVTRSSTGLPLHGSAFVQPICRLHYSAVNVYVLYVPD